MNEMGPEEVKSLARLICGLFDDIAIAKMEKGLAASPEQYTFPMPNTSHLAYAKYAGYIRSNFNNVVIRMPKFPKVEFMEEVTPDKFTGKNYIELTRKRYFGMMPFVGDPRKTVGVYTWFVWTDEFGRHIAGDARMVLEPLKVIQKGGA